MKRRSLFTMVPALSGLLALRSHGESRPAAGATAAGFTIAVQLWSFREFGMLEAIGMAGAAGAHAELFPNQRIGGEFKDLKFGPGIPEKALQAVRDELERRGVRAVNFGVVRIPADEAKAREFFSLAQKLGIPAITTESVEAIDTIEKLSRETGIAVCFHNHPKPTALWNPQTVAKVLEGRHEALGFCADVGHWATSGLDPVEVVRENAARVRAFHLKDRARIDGWSHDRPFGTGILDIPAMLDAVGAHGFKGNVSIEYEHNWRGNLAEVAQCAGYLRGYAASRVGR